MTTIQRIVLLAALTCAGVAIAGFGPPQGSSGGGSTSAFATRLSVNTTSVGNDSTGEDDLMSATIPAGTLATDGDQVVVFAWGKLGSGSGSRYVRAHVDGTEQVERVLGGNEPAPWQVVVRATRISSTLLELWTEVSYYNSPTAAQVTMFARGTEAVSDLAASSFVIKCTGENDAGVSNDVVQYGMTVDHIPAP